MPTYQYICKNCGHELEELQSISEPPIIKCPQCGQDTLARVVGSGSGLIFKGSGFYLTDYVRSEKQKSKSVGTKKEETKIGTAPASSEGTQEAKTEKKSPPPPSDSKKK